jgi:hypothetical protein
MASVTNVDADVAYVRKRVRRKRKKWDALHDVPDMTIMSTTLANVGRISTAENEVCSSLGSAACDRLFAKKSKTTSVRSDNGGQLGDDKEPSGLLRRRLLAESFYPSFSARDVFCRSRFRERPPSEDAAFKIIDGTEAPIDAFPWVVSLQYRVRGYSTKATKNFSSHLFDVF